VLIDMRLNQVKQGLQFVHGKKFSGWANADQGLVRPGHCRLYRAICRWRPADRLDVLTLLVEHHEKTNFPISDPDPIEFLEHVTESRGLSRKDLEPMIGPRGRVADIMNKTRPLTLEIIRRLVVQLKLPADVLVKPYALREEQTA
jgi:HTH-type transcriptional regulator/antitoxin HigA